MRIYVLGGGVAGLLSVFHIVKNKIENKKLKFHKIFWIYDKYFGQMAHNCNLGPRLIELSPQCDELFNFLKIKKIKKIIKIGYKKNFKIFPICPEGFKKDYVFHTRETKELAPSYMTSNNNLFNCYDINYIEILKKIAEFLEYYKSDIFIIRKKIQSIKDNKITFYDSDIHDIALNSVIINTIPLPIFQNIYKKDLNLDLEAFDTSFLKIFSNNALTDGFDYIYNLDTYRGLLFHRITKLNDKNEYILEYKGNISKDLKNLSDLFFLSPNEQCYLNDKKNSVFVFHNCQIKKSHNLTKIDDINLVGRYAQWSHKMKFDECIKRIKTIIQEI